jgi:TrmH family RNA methyltransferase
VNTLVGKRNPRLVQIRKALRGGTLTDDGLLPVEGSHLLVEAVHSNVAIHELYLIEGAPVPAGIDGVPIQRVAASTFRTLGRTRESQGAIALVSAPGSRLDEVFRRAKDRQRERYGPVLVLCGIQDPGNAGTMLRAAEAFGAAGVVVTPGSVGCYNDKLVRASAGSLLRLPWAWEVDIEDFSRAARERGIRILGAGADGAVDLDAVNFTAPAAVLIGREGAGLTPVERACADDLVRIPLRPPVQSLNAASAAAVILYAASRGLASNPPVAMRSEEGGP